MDIKALNLEGKSIHIEKALLDELRTKIRGSLILPEDPTYDETRKIWNAMVDRRPAFIVQCKEVEDIIQAVKFAKASRLLISIRGGGHNIAGRSLFNDMMLLDLSKMRSVVVNTKESTATVQPGATLADVDRETQAFGLAVPVGINSTTGIAGLTLGGGFGWLSRKYGMTVDNLISAEVVTVEGERIVCDREHHPDLFWAICGGGGNFGIISSFKFKLSPVGPEVIAGPTVFKLEDAKTVFQKYREFTKNNPIDSSIWTVLRNAPPFPFLDPSMHGKPVLIIVGFYGGSLEEGKKVLSKIGEWSTPLGNGVGPVKYADFQQAFDPLLIPGVRNYWKSHNFKVISDDLIDIMIDFAKQLPNPQSEIFIGQVGGKTKEVSKDATAYPHRDTEYIMNVHTRWENKTEDEHCISWARKFYKASEPFAAKGVYSNFVSEGDDNIQEAYGENASRLKMVKMKYDPENVLRSNLNIAP